MKKKTQREIKVEVKIYIGKTEEKTNEKNRKVYAWKGENGTYFRIKFELYNKTNSITSIISGRIEPGYAVLLLTTAILAGS